jgi:hypothetical protein
MPLQPIPPSGTINSGTAVVGKPLITVSGTGFLQSGYINSNCDFGPDTEGTTTNGQAEANAYLNAHGTGTAVLMNNASLVIVPSAGNNFVTASQLGSGGTGGSVVITGPLDGSGYVQVDLMTALPAGANTIGTVILGPGTDSIGTVVLGAGSASVGTVVLGAGAATVGTVILGAGAAAIGSVGVTSLPAIPAGSNNIGNVALLAGAAAIGTVGVTSLPALPAGSNSIGTVVLGAGAAAIGSVAVSSLPSLPAGANSIGTVVLGAGAASVGTVILGAGAAAIGSVTVTSLPALPSGANSIGTVVLGAGNAAVGTVTLGAGAAAIGSVTLGAGAAAIGTVGVTSLPALAAGANSIGTVVVSATSGAFGHALNQDTNGNVGIIDKTALTQPIAPIFNTAITASTNIFGAPVGTAKTPCYLRVDVSFAASGVLYVMRTNGGVTTQSAYFGGNPLAAGSEYLFDIIADTGDTFNFQYSTSCTCNVISVNEIDIP